MTTSKASAHSSRVRSAIGLSGLVFVFIAVTFVNQQPMNDLQQLEMSSQLEGRKVASVNSLNFEAEAAWKKNLATQIAQMSDVPKGKAARPASALEKFVFGELKGYYLMHLHQEKVREMSLNQRDASDAPRYLGQELRFLQTNRDFWWLDFSELEVKEQNSNRSVVALLDATHKVVGEADFAWDSEGRLLSLKINKVE